MSFVPVKLTRFTSTGIATKTLTYTEAGLESDKRPEMYRGYGETLEVSLPMLPEFFNSLTDHQAISTGIANGELPYYRFATRKKLETEYGETCVHDETGWQVARLSENFKHDSELSFMVFDYDPSDSEGVSFNEPQEFVDLLVELCPAFAGAAYVAKYSTSSNVYYNGQLVSGPSGFHVYFAVQLGSRTQEEISLHLEQQAWLKGYGYIKVSASGALLTRVPFDTSVTQTNRIMYEAPANLASPGLTQNNEAWFVDGDPVVILSKIAKPNSNTKTRQVQQDVDVKISTAKQAPEILEQVAKIKQVRIEELVAKHGYSRRQAHEAIDLQMAGILSLDHVLYFDDGRCPTVQEVMLNWTKYHGLTLADPLQPDKGSCKAMFYANDLGANPVIHTFVRGEGNYYLSDSWQTQQQIRESDIRKDFEETLGAYVLETGFSTDDRWFNFDLPNDKLIALIGDQGTGKTEQVVRWQQEDKLGRMLAVAPRIALVVGTAHRLGISAYTDEGIAGNASMMADGISTTLDSIHKFQHYPVDTLFLDEFEQLVAHLTAKTMKNRRKVLATLTKLCHHAKHIIMADADLSSTTVQKLTQLGILPPEKITAMVSHYQACAGGVIHMVESELGLSRQVLDCAQKGEGIYIATNQRGGLHNMARMLLKQIGPEKAGYTYRHGDFIVPLRNGQRMVLVTKDNSGLAEVGEFTRDINSNLRDNDILMTSPSISTGVSINVINGIPRLKNRFMIVSSIVGTTTGDAVQHLERIRAGHKCKTFVYVDQANHRLENDASKIIKQDRLGKAIIFLENNSQIVSHETLYNAEFECHNQLDMIYDEIYGYVTRRANLDRNNFAFNLRARLVKKGYQLEDVVIACDDTTRNTRKQVQLEQQEYLKNIDIDAPLLNDAEYDELRKSQQHTTIEEQAMLRKNALARVLGVAQQSVMDEIMGWPKTQQRALEDAMMLGITPERAVQIDLSTWARMNGPSETSLLYERGHLARELMQYVGLSFDPHNLPQSDGRALYIEDIIRIYDTLRERDVEPENPGFHHIKALLGISVNYTTDPREKGKIVANVYRKLGILFKRTSIRNPEDKSQTIHVRYVDVDWLKIIRERLQHARRYSQHPWFADEIEVPSSLLQYRIALELGTPHVAPTMCRIMDNLEGDYRAVRDAMLETGRFTITRPTE